jgi:hypothetical protein
MVRSFTAGPNHWARTFPQDASSDNGVDFEFRAVERFPFLCSEDRPHPASSSISEGAP